MLIKPQTPNPRLHRDAGRLDHGCMATLLHLCRSSSKAWAAAGKEKTWLQGFDHSVA